MGAAEGRERCPHCQRLFKRLRQHLPHCKAAPSTAPSAGTAPGPASGVPGAAAPGAGSSRPRAAAAGKGGERLPGPGGTPREAAEGRGDTACPGGQGGEAGPGPGRQPGAPRGAEGVGEGPGGPSDGVEVVIEKHRAKVIRGRSGNRSGAASGGRGTARAPLEGPGSDPREGKVAPGSSNPEPRGPGTAGNKSASKKGEKGSVKATKTPPQQAPAGAEHRSSPGDPIQREGTGTATEGQQMHLEAGVEYKAPLSALHTKSLHLSAVEGFRGHDKGASKNHLAGTQTLQESREQMAGTSEPILQARRDTELAWHQSLLHTSKSQPICLPQAPGRSTPARATGLEWFPDLYPNYHSLSVFPGKQFRDTVGITMWTPKGNFSEGQQGPLSERRLMDVRLGELPAWLTTCNFSPQGLLGGMQKAWSSYYDKYINVKRGGPAGITMLLAGYCILSYSWNYQHIKYHRWRKYH